MPAKRMLPYVLLYALLVAKLSAADVAPPEPAPTLEMLEFLGNWETTKGEPVDPAQFADAGFTDAAAVTDKPPQDNKHDQHQ